jgi:hypothetical protein
MTDLRRTLGRHGLLLIPLLVGTLLSADRYARTVCLTEDGVTFLRYARQLGGEGAPVDPARRTSRHGSLARGVLDRLAEYCPTLPVLEVYDQHPGYPLLILAARRTVGDWLADDPRERWSRSAQVISLLAGLALTGGVYLLGRRLLGPAAGYAGAVVVAVSPEFVAQRADALSDAAALACLAFSAWLAVRALAAGRPRDAALCGLCAGAGYLVRPEAVQVAAVLGLVLAARWVQNSTERRRLTAQLAALALPLLLLCGPYMAVRGSVFTKSGSVLVGVNTGADPLLLSPTGRAGAWGRFPGEAWLPRPDSPPGKLFRGCKRFLTGWVRDLGGALAIPVFLGLWLIRWRVRRYPGHRLILLVVALNVVLLPGVLFYQKGYLDNRHVLPVAALTACWAWPGLRAAAAWVATHLRCAPVPSFRVGAAALLTLLALAELPGSWSAAFHGERFGHRLAGEWLAAHAPQRPWVYDVTGLAAWYAGLADRNVCPPRTTGITTGYLESLAECCPGLGYIVIADRCLDDRRGPAAVGGRLEEVTRIPASLDPSSEYRVRVYHVRREDSQP